MARKITNIGVFVRNAINEKGLTIAAVSEGSGVSERTINSIIRGRLVKTSSIQKVLDTMRISGSVQRETIVRTYIMLDE